jgi:hypothetical protein
MGAASSPVSGTLYISGDDSGGTTRSVQWDGMSGMGDQPVSWVFQNPFGVTKRYRDAASITNNLKMLMTISVSQGWITTANWLTLEQISSGRGDNQLTVELYLNVTGGSETEFYLDGSTASTVNGTSIRTCSKAKFKGPITVHYFDPSKAKWLVSFEIEEELG